MTLYYAHAEPNRAAPTDISIRVGGGRHCIAAVLTFSLLARRIEDRYIGRWIEPAGNDLARYQVESRRPERAP